MSCMDCMFVCLYGAVLAVAAAAAAANFVLYCKSLSPGTPWPRAGLAKTRPGPVNDGPPALVCSMYL